MPRSSTVTWQCDGPPPPQLHAHSTSVRPTVHPSIYLGCNSGCGSRRRRRRRRRRRKSREENYLGRFSGQRKSERGGRGGRRDGEDAESPTRTDRTGLARSLWEKDSWGGKIMPAFHATKEATKYTNIGRNLAGPHCKNLGRKK